MNTSKALKRLLLFFFLSSTGSSYPHKPVDAHTHADKLELLEKLRARPEYRELAEHFSLVANQHTRTGKNVPAKTRRQALISCMTTLEKLEETYPSPLLTDVATWCSTQFKPRKKLAPWKRNAIIIGSTAAAALVLTLAAKKGLTIKQRNTLLSTIPSYYPSGNLVPYKINAPGTEGAPTNFSNPHLALRQRLTLSNEDAPPTLIKAALHMKLIEMELEQRQKLPTTIMPSRSEEIAALKHRLSNNTVESITAMAQKNITNLSSNGLKKLAAWLEAYIILGTAQQNLDQATTRSRTMGPADAATYMQQAARDLSMREKELKRLPLPPMQAFN